MSIDKAFTKENLDYNKIDRAVRALYDSWNGISEYTVKVLKAALESENLEELFEEQVMEEEFSKQEVLHIIEMTCVEE